MRVFRDNINLTAISIANNPIHHDRTKYVKLDHYYVKEKVELAIMNLIYTPTHLHVVDN